MLFARNSAMILSRNSAGTDRRTKPTLVAVTVSITTTRAEKRAPRSSKLSRSAATVIKVARGSPRSLARRPAAHTARAGAVDVHASSRGAPPPRFTN